MVAVKAEMTDLEQHFNSTINMLESQIISMQAGIQAQIQAEMAQQLYANISNIQTQMASYETRIQTLEDDTV